VVVSFYKLIFRNMAQSPILQEGQEGSKVPDLLSNSLIGLARMVRSTGDQAFLAWLEDSGLASVLTAPDFDEMKLIGAVQWALKEFPCSSPLMPSIQRDVDAIAQASEAYEMAALEAQIVRIDDLIKAHKGVARRVRGQLRDVRREGRRGVLGRRFGREQLIPVRVGLDMLEGGVDIVLEVAPLADVVRDRADRIASSLEVFRDAQRLLALSRKRLAELKKPKPVEKGDPGLGSDVDGALGDSFEEPPVPDVPCLESLQGVRIALVCFRANSTEDLGALRYIDLQRSLEKAGASVRLCTSLNPSAEGSVGKFAYDVVVVVEGSARGVCANGTPAVDFGIMPKPSKFAKEVLVKVNKRGGVEGVIERLRANAMEAVEVEK